MLILWYILQEGIVSIVLPRFLHIEKNNFSITLSLGEQISWI